MIRLDELRLEPAEFRLLSELFNHHAGITFGVESRQVLERRLRERLASLGLRSFGEYYQLLRYEDRARSELDEAIDLVTINETYFFRESYQLRAFRSEVLPNLPQGRERLSIWSAGCSTGEEVYTIAMLLRECALFEGWELRVLGSDITRRCIAVARRGVYQQTSFRTTPDHVRRRYFHERDDGFHVHDSIRALCHFGQLNLLDEQRTKLLGRIDAIFCRNVLIYLDGHARKRVIDMFHERLQTGGVLLLGHSESLLNVTTAFELLHLREDLVYRKPNTSNGKL